VVLHTSIGLGLALLLRDPLLRFKGVYRVLLILPWAVPNYITALIWKWVFNTQYGPANAFLALLGLPAVDWLGRSFLTNFAANLVTNTWLGCPLMMVVSLGALQSIPADLYEAAEIDGAGRWQRFRYVTLPLLKPALFPAIILGTIWTFNMFNVVYLVSGGAPDNQTNILITEAYRAFRVLKNFGLAAAYSLIIFIILAAYTAVTNRMTKAAESVYE
jgi:arabinogalactan oligomer/maltooligosaccharide transport system permease protein